MHCRELPEEGGVIQNNLGTSEAHNTTTEPRGWMMGAFRLDSGLNTACFFLHGLKVHTLWVGILVVEKRGFNYLEYRDAGEGMSHPD